MKKIVFFLFVHFLLLSSSYAAYEEFGLCPGQYTTEVNIVVDGTPYECTSLANCGELHYTWAYQADDGPIGSGNCRSTVFGQVNSYINGRINYEYAQRLYKCTTGVGISDTTQYGSVIPNATCSDEPPPDESGCSEKDTSNSFLASYSGSNSYNLTGCLNGCVISTSGNENIARQVDKTANTVNAFSSFTGAACGSESEATENTTSGFTASNEPLGALDPTDLNPNFSVNDADTGLSFEYDSVLEVAVDSETTFSNQTPDTLNFDVTSSNINGNETSSVLDNEVLTTVNPDNTEKTSYQIIQSTPDGDFVVSELDVHYDPTAVDGDPNGGDGSGNGDGTSVDLSGVESKLDQVTSGLSDIDEKLQALIDVSEAGDVTFSGSCEGAAPVCDETKPFCQQIKAAHALKCSEYLDTKNVIDEITNTDAFNGRGELTEDFDLLPILSDITNIQKTGQCPADSTININLGGVSKSITFDTQPYCDFADTIRPMILFIGIFLIIRIISSL